MEGQNTDTRVQIVFISPEGFILSTISKYKSNFSYIVPFINIDIKRGFFGFHCIILSIEQAANLKRSIRLVFCSHAIYCIIFTRYHEANSSVTPKPNKYFFGNVLSRQAPKQMSLTYTANR